MECNTVTQHWAVSLPRRATTLSRASSIGDKRRWAGTHAHTHTRSLTLTCPYCGSPTKGPYMQSPEYNPVGTHLTQHPATRRQVPTVSGPRTRGSKGCPAYRWWVVGLWVHYPVSHPHSRFPNLARAMSNFTQKVRTLPRGLQLPNHTPARRHGSTSALIANQQDQREC